MQRQIYGTPKVFLRHKNAILMAYAVATLFVMLLFQSNDVIECVSVEQRMTQSEDINIM